MVLLQTTTCRHALRALGPKAVRIPGLNCPRQYSQKADSQVTNPKHDSPQANKPRASGSSHLDHVEDVTIKNTDTEPGAMTRRLQQATEDALLTGGRAGQRAVEEAGFDEELKNRLLEKVAAAQFKLENESILREAGLLDGSNGFSEAVGQGSRGIATAQPWTGQEATEDAVLRMLDDAHKPLRPGMRGKPKIPRPDAIPVDMRLKRQPRLSPGHKAAHARDKASMYSGLGLKDKAAEDLTEKDKEVRRRELRERFGSAARGMPNSVTGLAALANERIEDAIARGQFKDIPRGKGIERDRRADNPFIDTTELILNNMIKRQDIVPPWIEKQQEVIKTANVFRARLRNDWKRHAARMIASRGGSLMEQMAQAEEYARAEHIHNPRRRKASDQIAVSSAATDDAVMVAARQEPVSEGNSVSAKAEASTAGLEPTFTLSRPFRDPDWQQTEMSYWELAIRNLNSLTRSYNLMAPELAKKPYFSLKRELDACFADVAPQIAEAIKERATRPEKPGAELGGHAAGSILDRFARESRTVRVYESRTPHYGLKEMWRDLWQKSP